MKILLSAYACEPRKGSEPGVGWNVVQQAARFHDVWVITQSEGRAGIEAALAGGELPNVRFLYLDLPRRALFWKKGRRGVQVHYYCWQVAAYFAGVRLHRKVCFDLVHHVTLVRYWMPSFLAMLPVPFIWGPVGGGESAPRSFWFSFGLRGKVFELARDVARKLGELDPFVRRTARRAILGLATTEETASRMRKLGCRDVFVLSEAGLSQEDIRSLSSIPLRHGSPFRLISVGRLLHWKAFHLSIQAFAEFHRQFPESEYWIIGDGPERKRLQKLAEALDLNESVTFWGNTPRQQVLENLAACDVLIHPSLYDSGGWACIEGMAAGRPVICFDLGGPGLQITQQTGVKVSPTYPDEAVADLAKAMLRLAKDPELRVSMAQACRQRVEDNFRWIRKGDFMNGIYETTITRPAALHNFNLPENPDHVAGARPLKGSSNIMLERATQEISDPNRL
jgi:glycosyltransferase involved in cell wall biosynthesis